MTTEIIISDSDNFKIIDWTDKVYCKELHISGEDLSAAIALYINTKKEMEEDNGQD